MRCPFCSHDETQVKDSRPADESAAIRRRRECGECGARFTTFERVQLREMTVIKADERTEPFERDKVVRSMRVALRKRPVTDEQIDKSVSSIVRQLESQGEPEIHSSRIGELVMQALARLDAVAYIRYASVYRDFSRPEDFNELLEKVGASAAKPQKEAAE